MQPASPTAPAEPSVSASSPGVGAGTKISSASSPPRAERGWLAQRLSATAPEVLLVGFWGLAATLLGRGLATALPGSSAGIGPLIVGVEQLGAFSSQFLVILGVATCLRLLFATLDCRSYLFHPIAIISSAAALPIVMFASSRHLSPAWLMALMGISAALALISALPALRIPRSRAAGLVLLTVTCGSIVSATGRIIALYASHQAHAGLFGLARGIATLGLVLDATSLVLVGVWLSRRLRFGAVFVLGIATASAALVWLGAPGNETSAWPLVIGRALSALTAHPDPFIGSGVRYFVEMAAICMAAVTLWFEWSSGVGAALCFALLARVSGDVPLCSLMLMLAALSAVRASLQTPRNDSARIEPSGRRAPLEVMPVTR
jgi:hypothetical protein